jgi:glucokinase
VAIASSVALLDVDAVVVGGGLSQAGPLLFEPLRAAYADHAGLDFARGAPIDPPLLGQEAGVVGAAALVLAGEAYWSAG